MPIEQSFEIKNLLSAYANGLDPLQVVDEVYRRIQVANDPGIFLHLFDQEAVLLEVRKLGPFVPDDKPLWGIPFVIKDNIDAKGAPTTAACPAFSYVTDQDAFVVKCLRDAGAILIGKTNLDQFATGLVGIRSPHTPPKNALDPKIIPGGSSSGSAVAVARGLVSFSLGTDTAGSGRVPAALNGIVGLKPTLGAISNRGVVPACRTLDTVSIFSLSVEDAHTVLRSAAVYDPSDPYARAVPKLLLGKPQSKFRVGVPDSKTREFFGDDLHAASFRESLEDIRALGGEIVELDFTPFYDVAAMLYEGAWVAERYTVVEDLLRDSPEALHPVFQKIIKTAENFSSADVFRGFYRLQELKQIALPLIGSVDLLCVPTIPTFYTVADLDDDPIGPNSRLGTYTNFVNLLDLCGIAVPTTPRTDGRPGSVTLLATADQDSQIAAIASALQQECNAPLGATDWDLSAPSNSSAVPESDEFSIAVVGAHMSGLPLNGQLTQLGARFLCDAKTAPEYRLYSLPGGPPFRPGLISDETGAAIDLEIWALPKFQFGEFMQGIPRPLGIGTLTLENGDLVKGFICEPFGITGAEDITQFGGWRNYLASFSTS